MGIDFWPAFLVFAAILLLVAVGTLAAAVFAGILGGDALVDRIFR